MPGYNKWFSRHITGKTTVNSYACVHLVFFMHITDENTVNRYACVHLGVI